MSHSLFTRFSLFSFFLIYFASCSVQKKIGRSAEEDVLDAAALKTAHVGISIYDAASGKYLYNYQGDKYFVPASNTKIPTCYAAMKYLGDSIVGLRYFVNDTVISIQPSGDPTFLHSDYKNQPVFDLLKKYKRVHILSNVFTDFLGSGWSWNDYQEYYMAQRSDLPIYGNITRFKWVSKDSVNVIPATFSSKTSFVPGQINGGMDISRDWEENNFHVFAGSQKTAEVPFRPVIGVVAELLKDTLKAQVDVAIFEKATNEKKVYSQPTDSLLKPMMHRSDNFFAEQSLMMVSNERLGVMNDARIIDTLLKTDFKDLPQKPRWVDGSGLSRYNLFTPQDFVAILGKMKTEFGMERIKTIFATGGTGTISSYYKADSGYIYAKTGTLSGVVALSGFLYTKKGKQLIFSVLVNNHQASATEVRRAVEKFLQGVRNNY